MVLYPHPRPTLSHVSHSASSPVPTRNMVVKPQKKGLESQADHMSGWRAPRLPSLTTLEMPSWPKWHWWIPGEHRSQKLPRAFVAAPQKIQRRIATVFEKRLAKKRPKKWTKETRWNKPKCVSQFLASTCFNRQPKPSRIWLQHEAWKWALAQGPLEKGTKHVKKRSHLSL